MRKRVSIFLMGPGGAGKSTVGALLAEPSGFMTYPRCVHPDYPRLRSAIERNPTTFVLIPCLDRERCVAETVRRQRARPFARSAAREEAVIRQRFPIYIGLRARKIETLRPVDEIVEEIALSARGSPAKENRA